MLRGVNRDPIFLDDEDRRRFLGALAAAKDACGWTVLAYCLMGNHVHLVLRVGNEALGESVRRVGVRYAGWFNRKYGRVGHLFQDRFKSVPVEDDAHLASLMRYVWKNPVEAGIVNNADAYRWSSRHLYGKVSDLIDAAELDRLLPDDPLAGQPDTRTWSMDEPLPRGPRPLHCDDEVRALLEQACGARCPDDFLGLGRELQQAAVRELRTRSVSFAQIARATGLSTSTLKRRHSSRSSVVVEGGPSEEPSPVRSTPFGPPR
ncbi:transposase [Propionicimonas sp.]|uniref:transposase n=1 Tax=Propionicimonas sp. TaxID=1955623 RepID=UPI0039E2FB73